MKGARMLTGVNRRRWGLHLLWAPEDLRIGIAWNRQKSGALWCSICLVPGLPLLFIWLGTQEVAE